MINQESNVKYWYLLWICESHQQEFIKNMLFFLFIKTKKKPAGGLNGGEHYNGASTN